MVRKFAKEVLPVQRAMIVEMSNVGVKERQFVFPRPLIRSSLIYIHCTSYVYTTPSSHLYTLHLALFCSCALYIHTCAQPLWSQLIRYLSSDERHMHTPLDIRLVFHCSPIGCQLLLSPVSIVTLLCPVFLLYYAPCLECITPQVPIVSPFYALHYTVFLFFKGSSHKKNAIAQTSYFG